MVDSICNFLTTRIRKEMPDIDDERAEVINYGIHLIFGEMPKIFLLFVIGFLLGIGELTILSFLVILPYRMFSGGFHAKTHIGCIVSTSLMYCGIALLSKYIIIDNELYRYIFILAVWVFGMMMVKLYAPADTENVPIISKKERKTKKILSYITLTLSLVIAIFIKDIVISNLIIYGLFIQSITITRLAYKITNNNYGHEVYKEEVSTS